MLSNSPMITLMRLYSDCSDIRVVKEPAPAMSGNTMGTIVAAFPPGPSLRKISMPNTISTAMANSTSEPAIANDATSTWNKPNIDVPRNKNIRNIHKE